MKRDTSLVQRMRLPALAGLVIMSLAAGGSRGQAQSEPFSHLGRASAPPPAREYACPQQAPRGNALRPVPEPFCPSHGAGNGCVHAPRWRECRETFSHILVFGDSLSDTGNYYRLSGGSPPPPYAKGRFCNGPIWVEYLAASLGMEYQPADNFAVGGATTGTLNSNDGFAGKEYPGLLDEVASFAARSPVREPGRALYVVEAGANDFFVALATGTSPATLIGTGVGNTISAIQQLRGAGARFILVMNVPDLGVTPMAQGLGEGGPLMLTQLSAGYNQALDLALEQLAQAGIPTIRLDAFAVLDEMANKPAAYGFSNVTTPFLLAPPGTSPDQFLFWDPVHPTTGAHEVLAQEALEQLISAFSPRNGRGTPDARAHALHGLTNDRQHNPWSRN
jgi:phospholipase/lecithinase/hemolysin